MGKSKVSLESMSKKELLQYISKLDKRNVRLENTVETLKEELILALYKKFMRSSETSSALNLMLFDEELSEEQEEVILETSEVKSYKRSNKGRKPLSDSLPRKEILHDISEEEKQCACGNCLTKIGEDVSEKLKIIPEQVFVEKHIRIKYACKNCEGSGDEDNKTVRIAPVPPSILPKSIATPALLAFIFVNKFCDALPFYRQEKRFERIGVNLSRQNMSHWSIKVTKALKPLNDLLVENIRCGPLIQMDETPIQVLKEPNKSNTSKSYMWLAKGGEVSKPVVYYQYDPSRKSKVIIDLLEGFSGVLQTDGYTGYETALKNNDEVTHVGCFAHARRKFTESINAKSKKVGSGQIAIKMIAKIYKEEELLRKKNLTKADFMHERKENIKPLLEEFKAWLDDKLLKVRDDSRLGKAISYTSKQWPKIEKYVDFYELTPDNNAAERAIKPFVIGRKNWLFSGSVQGAEASAFLYSLVETAKANKLNPYSYLEYIFEVAPTLKSEDFNQLLPWNIDKENEIFAEK